MFHLHRQTQNRIVGAIGMLAALVFSFPAGAQTLPEITRFAPEDVVFCLALTGQVKPDGQGSSFERWMAQQEVKDSYLNIVDFVKEQLEANDPSAAELADLVPQAVFQQPWILFLDDPDMETPKLKFVLQLGDLESKINEKLTEWVRDSEREVTDIQVAGRTFQRTSDEDGNSVEYGFHENHLLVAYGDGELEKLVQRFNATEPKWVAEIKTELPVERTLGLVRVDVKRLVQSNSEPAKEGELLELLKLDEVEKIVGIMGFDGEETVNRISFHCPQELTGLWKMFDVQPLKKEDYRGVADSVHSLSSIKFQADVLWKLLLQGEDSRADMEEVQSMMEEQFQLDFEKDIIDNLGEHVYSYQQFSLLNPQSNALLGVEIRNPEAFQARLSEFVESFEETNESFGIDVEETKNGPLYQVVPFEPEMQMFFPGIAFQLVDNQLLVALDSKAISSHLRKAGREGGKLTDDPRMARIFDTKQNGDLGQPIGVFYLDVKVLIESMYAVVPMVLGQFDQMGGDLGFDMEMLPPLEKAVEGVLPDIVAIYRTNRGFQIVERSTLPGISMTGAMAVGLTLPAVAQARGSARRAMSRNNLRQLGLAAHNYESVHRAFPPAYKTKDQKKLLSWRVELLPYLEEQELYDRFKHDEPWDSPHNKALIEEMPELFQVPGLELDPGHTVYLGVAGKDSVFVPSENEKGISFQDIQDGSSNTVMIVEANKNHAVVWTAPEDFDVDAIEDPVSALKGNWPGGVFQAAMCDGSVHALKVSNETLKKMATIRGGELVEDWFDD